MVRQVRAMATELYRRGPDDGGEWVDPEAGIALGFRRLAIIDVSADGHQPMFSASGRYVIVFNGEVYNFQDLRQRLSALGEAFRGHSDTEVLLAAIDRWGVGEAVRQANGMFAFALWDRRERQLHLARDAMGIKPLYFGFHRGVLFWGSEIKALRAAPWFCPEVDRDALTLYLRHGFVPSPFSIYRDVWKLEPGVIRTFRAPGADSEEDRYWSVDAVAEQGAADPFTGSDEEAIVAVEETLSRAVARQMVADVPLGAFLSGGIDSSLLVSLMQARSSKPVQTFSIGYSETAFNEAGHARTVAEHLGTNHHEWIVSPQDALATVPELATYYDEPFADPAMLPTVLVSRLARTKVTVSLSGDGADECFGGYDYHLYAARGGLANALGLPLPLRRALAAGASGSSSLLERLPSRFARRCGISLAYRTRYLHFEEPTSWYRTYVLDQLGRGDRLVGAPQRPAYALTQGIPNLMSVADAFMLLDQKSLLPDGYLTKVDRASMAFSLEGRVPYLDTDLVALAWRLPPPLKVRGSQGKWVLRQLLRRYLPSSITERPKQGFGVPLGAWLRGPLEEWATSLLEPRCLKIDGLLADDHVQTCWREHSTGIRDHGTSLWRILMFQAWMRSSALAPH
jgi:asparagine synthase (glutamine-hydrolysing)